MAKIRYGGRVPTSIYPNLLAWIKSQDMCLDDFAEKIGMGSREYELITM